MKKQITKFLLILIICAVTLTGFAMKAAATGGTGDAGLSSLEVSPGTLSPEFSSGCYEYSVEVGEDCDKLLVNAQTADSGAKLVIAGNSGLKAGVNFVYLNVTAADGVTTAKYTIQVTRGAAQGGDSDQAGQTQAEGSQVGGGIASSPLIMGNRPGTDSRETESAETQAPGETPESAETVGGEKNLEDGDVPGSGELPEDGDVPAQAASATITTAGKTYTLSRPDEAAVPGGFEAVEISVGGQNIPAWQFPSVYEITGMYLVYGTSQEGKTAFYIYDESEGTMVTAAEGLLMMGQESQISQNQLRNAQEAYQKSLKGRMMVIIGLSVVCFLLVIALTASLTRKKHSDDRDQEAFYRESSYQEAYDREAYDSDRDEVLYEDEDDGYSDSYEKEEDDSASHEEEDGCADPYEDDNGYEDLFGDDGEETYEPELPRSKESVSGENEEALKQEAAGDDEREEEPLTMPETLETDTAPLPRLGDTEKLEPVQVEEAAQEPIDTEKNDLEDLDLEDLDLENLTEASAVEKAAETKESGLEEVEFGESGFEEIVLEMEEAKEEKAWEDKKLDEAPEPVSEEISEEDLFPLPEDDEDLDAEFDLLSALLSDSVKSSRPDGGGNSADRKK